MYFNSRNIFIVSFFKRSNALLNTFFSAQLLHKYIYIYIFTCHNITFHYTKRNSKIILKKFVFVINFTYISVAPTKSELLRFSQGLNSFYCNSVNKIFSKRKLNVIPGKNCFVNYVFGWETDHIHTWALLFSLWSKSIIRDIWLD